VHKALLCFGGVPQENLEIMPSEFNCETDLRHAKLGNLVWQLLVSYMESDEIFESCTL